MDVDGSFKACFLPSSSTIQNASPSPITKTSTVYFTSFDFERKHSLWRDLPKFLATVRESVQNVTCPRHAGERTRVARWVNAANHASFPHPYAIAPAFNRSLPVSTSNKNILGRLLSRISEGISCVFLPLLEKKQSSPLWFVHIRDRDNSVAAN